MEPKYKGQQLVEITFPANGIAYINLNSLYPVDKIRITCFDSLTMTNFTPGILVWSNLVNNYIGTVGTDYAYGAFNFSKPMRVENGIDYWYYNKMLLNGEYTVQFTDFLGNIPTNINDEVYILVEYFIY